MAQTVAFLGLGAMGFTMACRVLDAGYALRIMRHRNNAPVDALASRGAVVTETPAELFRGADIAVSIVPADRELEQLYLESPEDALPREGSLLLEMTTARPATMRLVADRLARRGVRVVDVPVSGGVQGAKDGSLSLLCGAEPDDLEHARPLLHVFGQRIYHTGGVGSGKAMKAVNQVLAASHTALAAEALAMIREMRLPEDVAYDVICNSSGMSAMFKNKFLKMRTADFEPNFTAALMHKDLEIALDGAAHVPAPVAQAASQVFKQALLHGMGREDIAAVFRMYSRLDNA